jgi:hypothetical protein
MPHLDIFANDILLMRNSLRECIYFSCKNNASFVTGLSDFIVRQKTSDEIKLIEDVYYIAKTQLTDEIIILPEPRTLEEAVEMRNLREMERFREVLSAWCDSLRRGKSTLEKKLRSDVRKANTELRRIKRWRKYKRSPLNFWLSAIGGHIALFSNIITIVQTVGGLYSRWSEHKNNWILLVQNSPRH